MSVIIVNMWMVMINSELICHYFNSHNQTLLSNVDPGFFLREGGQFLFRKHRLFFLLWNHNRLRLLSRKVIVKCFILDSNMWSCCFKNLGVRQVDLMGVGPRPLLEGAFLPKPPPIFNYYRVHELGLWCPILELFLRSETRLWNLHSRLSFWGLELFVVLMCL